MAMCGHYQLTAINHRLLYGYNYNSRNHDDTAIDYSVGCDT